MKLISVYNALSFCQVLYKRYNSKPMKESQFLGTLLPAHPDFLPIEKVIREKYYLAELSPEDDPIAGIFSGTNEQKSTGDTW